MDNVVLLLMLDAFIPVTLVCLFLSFLAGATSSAVCEGCPEGAYWTGSGSLTLSQFTPMLICCKTLIAVLQEAQASLFVCSVLLERIQHPQVSYIWCIG